LQNASYKLDVSGTGHYTGLLTLDAGLTLTGTTLMTGDLTVTGTVTAQEFHAEFVSSSIIYESGSTKFGDSTDDIHWRTGSLYVSGSDHHFFGNVGIGVTKPIALLQVGTGAEPGTFSVQSSIPGHIANFRDSAGENVFQATGSVASGDLKVSFGDVGEAGSSHYFTVADSTTYFMNGSIGIGVSTPTVPLQVEGILSASSTVWFPNIGTGVDNSVVILDSDGSLRTDEIDSRV
jgi:hypothetical protein